MNSLSDLQNRSEAIRVLITYTILSVFALAFYILQSPEQVEKVEIIETEAEHTPTIEPTVSITEIPILIEPTVIPTPTPTPTAIITPAIMPRPAQSSQKWNKEQTTARIIEVFGDNAENALKIAQCESGIRDNAISPTNDYGVFQIH